MNASAFSAFTGVFNTTGHPAMSVPAGVDGNGLPIGVQFVGPARRRGDAAAVGVGARGGGAVADRARRAGRARIAVTPRASLGDVSGLGSRRTPEQSVRNPAKYHST